MNSGGYRVYNLDSWRSVLFDVICVLTGLMILTIINSLHINIINQSNYCLLVWGQDVEGFSASMIIMWLNYLTITGRRLGIIWPLPGGKINLFLIVIGTTWHREAEANESTSIFTLPCNTHEHQPQPIVSERRKSKIAGKSERLWNK